jgi:hypothetical protein
LVLHRHGFCCWLLDSSVVGRKMKTVELTGYIYFSQYDWERQGRFVISEYPRDITEDENRKFISEEKFVVTVPDYVDMKQTKIDALNAEKKRVEAEFAAKVTQINRKINELLAIENT